MYNTHNIVLEIRDKQKSHELIKQGKKAEKSGGKNKI
jgi:hypothetical protein